MRGAPDRGANLALGLRRGLICADGSTRYGAKEAIQRLLGGLRWSGLFNLQFIARNGERHLIDLNPRVCHSLALARSAGLNLPAIWVSRLVGESVSSHEYREGVRFRAETHDLRALVAAFRRGERRRVLAGLVPRRGTVHALWSVSDPMPVLTEVAHFRSWLRRGAGHDLDE